jgi:peptidyl-prolyl cis-trans isomerase SurA
LCLLVLLLGSGRAASAQNLGGNNATKAPEPYRDQIVAEVEHEPITLHELELSARLSSKEYRDLRDNQPGNVVAIRATLDQQLQLLLDEKILLLECTRDKVILTKDDEKRIEREVDRHAEPHGGLEGLKAVLAKIGVPYDYFVERKKTTLLITKLLMKNVSRDIYVEPERIRKYYDEHKRERFRRDAVTKFYQVDIFNNLTSRVPEDVKHLVDKWNQEEAQRYAEKVREKLARSPAEWRTIAGAATMDQSAVETCGLVQVRGNAPLADQMAGDLGKAIDNLKPGEVSQVIKSGAGYHIFCLKERSGVDVLPFSEVQHQIQETLRQEIWQERLKAWIGRVKDEHPVRKYLALGDER